MTPSRRPFVGAAWRVYCNLARSMPPSHHPNRKLLCVAIKRNENTFLGEGQIYNIGSPAYEPIPDYQSIMNAGIDDVTLNRILNEQGKGRPVTGTKLTTKLPVGLRGARRGGIFKSMPIVPEILQRSTRTIEEINGIWNIPTPPFIPTIRRPQVNVAPPTIRPTVSRGPILNSRVGLPKNIIAGEPTMSLDLGALITGLGSQYINAKYPIQTQPVGWPSFQSIPEYLGYGGGTEVIEGTGGGICPIIPKGYYVTAKGEIRKKAKRRRRRLATPSDIKDLAALSSVTTGPEKKQWIATHPS